jgi:hypothetical protein
MGCDRVLIANCGEQSSTTGYTQFNGTVCGLVFQITELLSLLESISEYLQNETKLTQDEYGLDVDEPMVEDDNLRTHK